MAAPISRLNRTLGGVTDYAVAASDHVPGRRAARFGRSRASSMTGPLSRSPVRFGCATTAAGRAPIVAVEKGRRNEGGSDVNATFFDTGTVRASTRNDAHGRQ